MKLFSKRVKELFLAYSFAKKADRFVLFLISIFWETDLRVTLGDFAGKNAKLVSEICMKWKLIK